jgi:hypothetical protein
MRNLSKLCSILFLILFAPKVSAVAVQSIYEANVPVVSQSDKDRIPAEKIALEQVLIKVSGNSHILENNPKVKASLNHAEDLVGEFNYVSSPDTQAKQPFIMTVRFDSEAVNALLRDAGSTVWGQSRPLILVWLAYLGPKHPLDVVDSSDLVIPSTLKVAAQERGIPFIFPMMDVSELNAVSVADVLGKNLPPLQLAAQRYASNGILIGHVTESDKGFDTDWELVLAPDHWSWNIPGKNLQEVLNKVVNNIADTLAGRYSAVMTNTVQSQVILRVTGVKQQSDLVQLMQYLQKLTPVADVQLKNVNGAEVILDLSLRGSKDSFIQAAALSRNLQPVSGGNEQDPSLQYQWNP